MSTPVGIGLRDAVAAIRAELAAAMADGAGHDLKFDVGPVQLDLAIDVTGQAGGEAGIKVWVLSLTGNASAAVTHSHRISVTLQPVDRSTGGQPRISDREESLPPRPHGS